MYAATLYSAEHSATLQPFSACCKDCVPADLYVWESSCSSRSKSQIYEIHFESSPSRKRIFSMTDTPSAFTGAGSAMTGTQSLVDASNEGGAPGSRQILLVATASGKRLFDALTTMVADNCQDNDPYTPEVFRQEAVALKVSGESHAEMEPALQALSDLASNGIAVNNALGRFRSAATASAPHTPRPMESRGRGRRPAMEERARARRRLRWRRSRAPRALPPCAGGRTLPPHRTRPAWATTRSCHR